MPRNTNKTDKTKRGSKEIKTKKNSEFGYRTVERSLGAFDRSTGRSKVPLELSTALKGSQKSSLW